MQEGKIPLHLPHCSVVSSQKAQMLILQPPPPSQFMPMFFCLDELETLPGGLTSGVVERGARLRHSGRPTSTHAGPGL